MSAPAGWYPDPQAGGRLRWWDGHQWTAHVPSATAPSSPAAPMGGIAAPGAPAPWAVPPAPPAPVRADTGTLWVWLAIVASVIPFAVVFLIDWNGYVDTMTMSTLSRNPSAAFSGMIQWQLHVLGISVISWVAMGLFIVFSWLDWRELRRRGVPLPFSWAWSFFGLMGGGAAVYMIGRAVVLKRRTESGGWPPLWTWIAATAVGYVVAFVWVFSMMGTIFTRMAGLYS